VRAWLEQVERSADGDDALAVLAWLAGADLALPDEERTAAIRRGVLLLAAGGDPHRAVVLDGRAVVAVADDLETPERRDALDRSLAALESEAEGLPGVQASLERLRADRVLAWRAFAAGLLGEELADE
jgi:hypothetical protein